MNIPKNGTAFLKLSLKKSDNKSGTLQKKPPFSGGFCFLKSKGKECDIACDDADGENNAGYFVAEFKKCRSKNGCNGSKDDKVHCGSICNGINSASAIEKIRNGKNGKVEKAGTNDVADGNVIVSDFEKGEGGCGFRKGSCNTEEECARNGFAKVESYAQFIGDIGKDNTENNNADADNGKSGKNLFS